MPTVQPSQNESKPRAHLLQLPPGIRARIFFYVGLPQGTVIYPETAMMPPKVKRRGGLGHHRPPPPFPWNDEIAEDLQDVHSLLLSCRTLYLEASSLLLGGNTIVTCDLHVLSRLTPSSLGSLTRLKIYVNSNSDCYSHHFGRTGRYSDLECGSRIYSQEFIDQWDAVIKAIASHASRRQLELWLIFDCDQDYYDSNAGDSVMMAERFVAPLRELRGLKNCHIRLGSRPNDALRAIAKRTVEQTRITDDDDDDDGTEGRPATPFPFFRLPPELRLEILSYTDLVTPWKYVRWDPAVGYEFLPTDYELCDPLCSPGCCAKDDTCRFVGCWTRAPGSDAGRSSCLCSLHHASYTDTCGCWRPPAPLFLVSRSFRRESRAVLFAHNDISISARAMHLDPLMPALSTDPLPSSLRWLQIELHCLYRLLLPEVRNMFGPVSVPSWPAAMTELRSRLRLRHLHVYANMEDNWQAYLELRKSYGRLGGRLAAGEADAAEVRGLVDAHVWPLRDAEGTLAEGTRQLLVSLGTETSEMVYYLRDKSVELPAHVLESHYVSEYEHREFRGGDGPVAEGYWFKNSRPSYFAIRL